ncbi:MAG: phage protease [Proteobacteria bacterium]|nr:phage protease [Pseudomonadota bacterium]MBU4472139.1 phage protease [Pseudomonadota bacterium]MCG2752862.1 phage protease [Desulfobacteraceae bacterium]
MINTQATNLAAALNLEVPSGKVPKRIELIPACKVVTGRDGRSWVNDRPESVIEAFNADGMDLVIDLEHATEIKAPNGEPAPAVGWINKIEIHNGGVWGAVFWNPAGKSAILNREYRYYSPVFLYEKASARIVKLLSVGLTNRPNLHFAALNTENMWAGGGESPLEFSEEQLKIAWLLGNTPEDIAKYGMESDTTESKGLSEEEAKIAWLLGVTAQDIKKYGGR